MKLPLCNIFQPARFFQRPVASSSVQFVPCFPRVTHGSLPPDKHNEAHTELPSRVLPIASFFRRAKEEDTYKVQYRYPYRDIPNIVVSISSVARCGRMPVWTLHDTCVDVVRTSALYTVPNIYEVVPTLVEKARFDESKNKRTVPKPPLDVYPDCDCQAVSVCKQASLYPSDLYPSDLSQYSN